MLSEDLISLVNSGGMVAFIGSGVSAQAGLPAWARLFGNVADRLGREGADVAAGRTAASNGDLPRAFGRLIAVTSRDAVVRAVGEELSAYETPGEFHRILVDWPFRFYVTTNYDGLLETAARAHMGAHAIGNSALEVRAMLPLDQGFIWHPHGSIGLPKEKSTLVLSDADYAEFYPKGRVADALEKIASTHRLLFIGFGFQDRALLSILDVVRQVTSADKPSYAFVPSTGTVERDRDTVDRFRLEYNVKVFKYDPEDEQHSGLAKLLRANSCFMRRRSIAVGERQQGAPEYDPVACSLLVHNRLLEDVGTAPTGEVEKALLRALVLSVLVAAAPLSRESLTETCDGLCGDVRSVLPTIDALVASGLVLDGPSGFTLSERGQAVVADSRSRLDHRRGAFLESVKARALAHDGALGGTVLSRLGEVVAGFFVSVCRHRGLGMAQSLLAEGGGAGELRATAMMQSLPRHLAECEAPGEVLAVVAAVRGILTEPRPAEVTYLGLLSQAYFGSQFLGTGEVRRVDLDHLASSCFVLDSNILISALAPGSKAGGLARRLIERLADIGASVVTTRLFLHETSSHWKWAERQVREAKDNPSALLQILTGVHGGGMSEVFEGYLVSRHNGAPGDFSAYLRSTLPEGSGRVTDRAIEAAVRAMRVTVLQPTECEGFSTGLRDDIGRKNTEITRVRVTRGTYTGDRQTQAEAEVAVLIRGLRTGDLRLSGSEPTHAYFISESPLMENMVDVGGRVTLRADGLWQWLLASRPFTEEAAQTLFQHLLHEFSVEGVEFIPSALIAQRFAGLFEASKQAVRQLTIEHRELATARLGPDPEAVAENLSVDDISVFAGGISRDAVAALQREVDAERRIKSSSRLTGAEKEELERFRARDRERKRKAKQRRRRIESGQHKGGRRRKRRR